MDIGIDLGTTFSVIAVDGRVELEPSYGEAIYLEHCDVSIIPSPFGEPTFPSVTMLGATGEEDRFGAEALEEVGEDNTPITFSKRMIGSDSRLRSGGKEVLAREVATKFLSYLKACAEQALGQDVHRAVITHPAYFDGNQVEETRNAAIDAGFDMSHSDQLVMEPVAAALSYSRADERDPLRLLTYDLGGGTFDVTVIQRLKGIIDMIAFDGDPLLGGFNFDRELVAWLRNSLAKRNIDIPPVDESQASRHQQHQLFQFVEQVKINLAEQEDPKKLVDVRGRNIIRDVNGRDVSINERICRNEFEALISPFLERTIDATTRVLKKAELSAEDIDEILLVGGSTRGPWVTDHLTALMDGKPVRLFEPDLCIAAGAAIHAAMTLPRLLVARDLQLIIDYPNESPDDVIQIAGTVHSESPLPDSARTLRLMFDGRANVETDLDDDGRFLFEDVELEEEGANTFRIVMANLSGSDEVSHEFTVFYDRNTSDASVVTTVLPQPMFIETHDGLVTIADEGQTLPARIERKFRRLNDNPVITLRLFQAGACTGEVRIENIPKSAGLDAQVELSVEVTTSGRVIGQASIWDAAHEELLAHAPVAVEFRRQEVRDYDGLMHHYRDLKAKLQVHLEETAEMEGDDAAETLSQRAQRLASLIDHLIQLEPVDLMEVQARLNELQQVAQPPPDVMQPTWKQFKSMWIQCRRQVEAIESTAKQVVDSSEYSDGDDGLDQSMVISARERYTRAVDQLEDLDAIHDRASDVHRMRDRPGWGKINDALQRVMATLDKDKDKRDAPTAIIKLLARRDVIRVLSSLHEETARLEREGRVLDWLEQIHQIHDMLTAAIFQITGIDDDLDDDTGRNMVIEIYNETVNPAEKAVQKLGIDLESLV